MAGEQVKSWGRIVLWRHAADAQTFLHGAQEPDAYPSPGRLRRRSLHYKEMRSVQCNCFRSSISQACAKSVAGRMLSIVGSALSTIG